MRKKWLLSGLAAALMLSCGITAAAAPEVIPVNGKDTVFDYEYYASANPDVAAALGLNRELLIQHYAACGKSEGRAAYAPGADVDALLAQARVMARKKKKKPLRVVGTSSPGAAAEWFNTTTYEYDEWGNVLVKTLPRGTQYQYTYTYDAQGNVLTAYEVNVYKSSNEIIGTTTTVYTYDAQGNVLTESYDTPGMNQTGTKEYIYDAQGNKEKMIARGSDGSVYRTLYYQYDESGNLIKEYEDTSGLERIENDFVYDGEGRVVKETRGAYKLEIGEVYDGERLVFMVKEPRVWQPTQVVTLDKIYDVEGNLTEETETTVKHYGNGNTSTSVMYLKYFYE